jgi:hypothetical protein
MPEFPTRPVRIGVKLGYQQAVDLPVAGIAGKDRRALVRVGIEDLFGHYKELEVKAVYGPEERAEWVSEPTLTEATAEATGGQPTS